MRDQRSTVMACMIQYSYCYSPLSISLKFTVGEGTAFETAFIRTSASSSHPADLVKRDCSVATGITTRSIEFDSAAATASSAICFKYNIKWEKMNAVVVPSPLVTGSDFTTSCISPTITIGVQQLFDTNAYCKTKSTIPRMPSRARSVTGAIAEPTTTNAPQPLTQRQPAQDPRPIRVSGGNKVRSGAIRLP